MMMHMTKAAGEVYAMSVSHGMPEVWHLLVHQLCHGSRAAEMFCRFSARCKCIWLSRIDAHETSTPAAVNETSHQKTVMAPLDRLMKLRHMKQANRRTHTYGVPHEVVRRK